MQLRLSFILFPLIVLLYNGLEILEYLGTGVCTPRVGQFAKWVHGCRSFALLCLILLIHLLHLALGILDQELLSQCKSLLSQLLFLVIMFSLHGLFDLSLAGDSFLSLFLFGQFLLFSQRKWVYGEDLSSSLRSALGYIDWQGFF